MLSTEAWMIVGTGAIAGILVLVHSWRRAEGRVGRLETEAAELESRLEGLRAELSKETQTRKRQADELATLRKRADKSKRRKSKSADPPLGISARIRDHEADVARVERERDLVIFERDELGKAVAGLEVRLETSARALEEARTLAVAKESPPEETALDAARNELGSSRERLTKLENELDLAHQTEARMRKRMSNQEQLYASLRAELDVKKDRLRTQEEQLQRLQALKAAVID